MVLEHAKWDPQVGDVSTLAPFPLVLPADVWRDLGYLAELLAAEAGEAERELMGRPDLIDRLGLPGPVRRALGAGRKGPSSPAAARVVRFDFHPTSEGWRISEANADVPGGYTEASEFPRLMAEYYPRSRPIGDPAGRLVEALVVATGGSGRIALVSAAGYMEDQQVTAYLATRLRRLGCEAYPARPHQVKWRDGVAQLAAGWYRGPLDAILRFYQGEWLARRPAREGWHFFFRAGLTPACNPGSALLVESKRFPLVWDDLSVPMTTWRTLLPPTRDPRRADWRRDPGWVLKTALCNTGDTVAAPGLCGPGRWREAAWDASLRPWHWVAQRRFETLAIETPAGPLYPCLGVYVVDGAAAGLYARMSPHPLIDFQAIDVAALVRDPPQACEPDVQAGDL
jgi:hypothetical protein